MVIPVQAMEHKYNITNTNTLTYEYLNIWMKKVQEEGEGALFPQSFHEKDRARQEYMFSHPYKYS